MLVDFFDKEEDKRLTFFVVEREGSVLINLSGFFVVDNKKEIKGLMNLIKSKYPKEDIVLSFLMVKEIDIYSVAYIHYFNSVLSYMGRSFSIMGMSAPLYKLLKLSDIKNEIIIR